MRSVVVFPQPDGPSMLKNSPRWMSRSRSSTAVTSLNSLVTRSSRTSTSSPPIAAPLTPHPHEFGIVPRSAPFGGVVTRTLPAGTAVRGLPRGHKGIGRFVQGGHRTAPARRDTLGAYPWIRARAPAGSSRTFVRFGRSRCSPPTTRSVSSWSGRCCRPSGPGPGRRPWKRPLIFAVFSLGMLAGFAAGAALIRRTGPRAAAVSGVALHLVADLLFIGSHSTQVYVIGRLLQGFGSGELWMASVFFVLARWPDRPGPWLGRMITAYAAGAIIGPLLAALGGAVRPFVGDAILSSFGFVAAFAMPARHGRTFNWGRGVLRDRRLAFGSLVALLNALIFTTIEGSYTLRFAAQLSQGEIGLLIALVTVTFGFGAMLPAASATGVQGRRAGQLALLLCAVTMVAIASSDSPAMWFVFAAILGAGLGMSETSA